MKLNKKKILLYANVRDMGLFDTTGFYVTDVNILRDIGYEVECTNKISRFLRFRSYDAVLVYFYRKGILPAFIAFLLRKPVFFTGGIDELETVVTGSVIKSWVQKILFSAGYFFSTGCNIVSESDLSNVKKIVGNGSKLFFFPHCIKFELFAHEEPDRPNIITTIAWMQATANVVRKGVDKSILVFNELLKMDNSYIFYIIGATGEGTDYLKNIIREIGMDDTKVIFTGSIPENEKINILKKSKYYFQLSNYEGFGIAAIEALAAGNCVVHSGKGGLKNAIADAGICINESNQYVSIAKQLIAYEQGGPHQKERLNGIDHVRKNFSYQRRLQYFTDLFKKALSRK